MKGKLPYGRNYHLRQYYAKKKEKKQIEEKAEKRRARDAFVDSIVDAIVTPHQIPDDIAAIFNIEIDQTNTDKDDPNDIDMDAIRHVFGDIKFEKTDQKQLVKNKVMRIMRKLDDE